MFLWMLFIALFQGFLLHAQPLENLPMNFQEKLESKTTIPIKNSSNTDQNLKFLSYNIQLNGLDIPTHLWKERKHVVSTLISYADVIALQEITHTQFCDLRDLLPEYEFIGFNTTNGEDLVKPSSDTEEGLAIAFRKDLFSLKCTDMKWYSDTPQVPSKTWGTWTSAFPKCLQTATLIFLTQENELDILNSHFAHDEDPLGIINPRLLSSQYELEILKKLEGRYWISAGDRNFHYPRDSSAYELYKNSSYVLGSKRGSKYSQGETTFMGYEDHPRMIPITTTGIFEKSCVLDVIFHNPALMDSLWWLAHLGEYDENLNLLPIGRCKDPSRRLFASDHAAVFVEYSLHNFYNPKNVTIFLLQHRFVATQMYQE